MGICFRISLFLSQNPPSTKSISLIMKKSVHLGLLLHLLLPCTDCPIVLNGSHPVPCYSFALNILHKTPSDLPWSCPLVIFCELVLSFIFIFILLAHFMLLLALPCLSFSATAYSSFYFPIFLSLDILGFSVLVNLGFRSNRNTLEWRVGIVKWEDGQSSLRLGEGEDWHLAMAQKEAIHISSPFGDTDNLVSPISILYPCCTVTLFLKILS